MTNAERLEQAIKVANKLRRTGELDGTGITAEHKPLTGAELMRVASRGEIIILTVERAESILEELRNG